MPTPRDKALIKKEKGKRKKSRAAKKKAGIRVAGKRETTLAGDTRSRTSDFERHLNILGRRTDPTRIRENDPIRPRK